MVIAFSGMEFNAFWKWTGFVKLLTKYSTEQRVMFVVDVDIHLCDRSFGFVITYVVHS